MSTGARIANHPIHPMLVVLPLGLWIFSWISDVIFLLGGANVWRDIAFYTMAGGLVGALIAAVPGIIDMLAITDPRTGKIAWRHMLINGIAVGVYAIDLFLRANGTPVAPWPFALSCLGLGLLGYSGWLGGEMVYVHGAGVASDARSRSETKPDPRKIRRLG